MMWSQMPARRQRTKRFYGVHSSPADRATRLNTAINKALATPRVREAFAKLGAELTGGTPVRYGELLNAQL
jgi:tripartite-type tricarboxylate transporter receptor subunit TctC